jgi:EAL domain-containing protein (putative c-di-GMP-specific phosphodiesterase class I)/GGDEF domain-containing protein
MNKAWLTSRTFSTFGDLTEPRYLYLCNLETHVSRWSKGAVDYFGLPGEYIEHAETLLLDYIHPDDQEVFTHSIQSVLAGNKPTQPVQYRVRNKKGHYVNCSCQGEVIPGAPGEPDLFAGTIDNHGITGNIDATTQLYNIYEFRKAMNQTTGSHQDALVMIVGLNQYSMVNSVYGYSFGNRVLKAFGQLLKDLVGNQGIVYRMDGSKFSLRLFQGTEALAYELYAQIQQQARSHIVVDGHHIPLGVSGGAMLVNQETRRDSCIRANITYAQERSKRECHSELVFLHPDKDGCTTLDTVKRNETIRQSVLNGCQGFYLRYQPLVNAQTGRIKGVEALLRWRNDTYGELAPGQFIQWLEQNDCFFELGNWILRQAMTDALPLVKEHPEFLLSVNVTYSQIERSDFLGNFTQILEQTGFPPENLYIELTERTNPQDITNLRRELDYFSQKGVKIALDDFGTGSASLNLLRQLPIDRLKIDSQFVAHIQTNRTDEIIVESVIDSANKLGISVCVEGIETEQLRDYVQKYNVDTLQGYYYSRPVDIRQVQALLGA